MEKLASFFALLLTLSLFGCEENHPVKVVYFQVAEKETVHGDFYILSFTWKEDIEQARNMIAHPEQSQIVLAEITKDSSVNPYKNKDINSDTEWSWYIAKFIGFVDFTVEIYDGWPQYVEDNYTEWVENTKGSGENGIIGFWGYTVVKEVDVTELE